MKIPYQKMEDGKCIAAISIVPASGFLKSSWPFVLMIAWEWESAAKSGRFKCYKGAIENISQIAIEAGIAAIADYGKTMTDEEIQKYFPFLLEK